MDLGALNCPQVGTDPRAQFLILGVQVAQVIVIATNSLAILVRNRAASMGGEAEAFSE